MSLDNLTFSLDNMRLYLACNTTILRQNKDFYGIQYIMLVMTRIRMEMTIFKIAICGGVL